MRIFRIVLLAGVFSAAAAGAFASGGGGGGGGGSDMPSTSAPQYDPAAEYAKALNALNTKDYKAAARAAQHVTDAVPKSVDGWKLLATAQAGAENWKGSQRAYEKAVKLAPDDVALHAGLGLALANQKSPKAQDELTWLKTKASACSGDCDAAQLQALTTQVEQAVGGGATPETKPSAALERGSLLFATAAGGDRAYVQAVSLINEKRYDEALKSLDAARAAFGPHPDILTYQGYTWRKMGQLDRAEGYYRQALAIAPNHVGATEYYGELKVERGDLAGARRMLAKLDRVCAYGCAEAETLRRWIDLGGDPGQ
ncbi:MAG: tetratricopeptide repeat protein [Caulobacterales bacterium]|nr:tetratricopeptide repeat protein [Caulobacterales bacterium]